jgi:hypothetical protein
VQEAGGVVSRFDRNPNYALSLHITASPNGILHQKTPDFISGHINKLQLDSDIV